MGFFSDNINGSWAISLEYFTPLLPSSHQIIPFCVCVCEWSQGYAVIQQQADPLVPGDGCRACIKHTFSWNGTAGILTSSSHSCFLSNSWMNCPLKNKEKTEKAFHLNWWTCSEILKGHIANWSGHKTTNNVLGVGELPLP